MKRKVIAVMELMLLAGALSACGGKKSDAVKSGGPKETVQAQTSSEAIQKPAPSESEVQNNTMSAAKSDSKEEEYPEDLYFLYTELDFGYSIRLLDFYHTDAGYGYMSLEPVDRKIEEHYSEVIYVTQYSGDVGDYEQKERIDMSQYHDSTDIFNLLLPNMDDELFITETVLECDVEEKGTKELNGVEMTKFEGNIKTVNKYNNQVKNNYLFVAYGIAGKKTPVLVCCIDRTEDHRRHAYWVDKIEDVVSTYKDAE